MIFLSELPNFCQSVLGLAGCDVLEPSDLSDLSDLWGDFEIVAFATGLVRWVFSKALCSSSIFCWAASSSSCWLSVISLCAVSFSTVLVVCAKVDPVSRRRIARRIGFMPCFSFLPIYFQPFSGLLASCRGKSRYENNL